MTDREDPLEGIIEVLREPPELRADLTERVMAEIDRLAPSRGGRPVGPTPWWRRRWTIQLTPVRGLALAAGVAVLLLAVSFAVRGPARATRPQTTSADQATQFVLVAPGARQVTLVGDFNDWNLSATPLERAAGDGVWHVTVALPPGRYRYAFVVDGRTWQSDPEAPLAEDDFGRSSSVVTVMGASSRRGGA